MLFTSELAGVMSTRDAEPIKATGWMRVDQGPRLSSTGTFRLAPGIFIVRRTVAWPVSVLDVARHLPWDKDIEPVKRKFPFPEWHARAACVGTEDADVVFFGAEDEENVPGRPPGQFQRKARTICRTCPAQRECLTQALTQPEHFGVWAGTTGRQRARMRERLKAGGQVEMEVLGWLARFANP